MSRKSFQTPQNRKSLLGFGSVRTRNPPEQKRLSFSANRSSNSGQPLKDTRKLSNKNYQKQMVEEIVGFLNESGYPHLITCKNLSPPTAKVFVQVFEHLYGLVNADFKMDSKFEEQVPKILKSLGYPFTISKSAMFSIGSLHSWPALLGALQWLVELVRVISFTDVEKMLYPPSLSDDIDRQQDKILFQYTSSAYQQFMSGRDDFEDEKKQLVETLVNQAGLSEAENIKMNNEIIELEKELATLELDGDLYEDALKMKNELEEKIAQHEVKSQQLDQKVQVVNQQKRDLQAQFQEEGLEMPTLGDPSRQDEIKHKSSETKEILDRLNAKKERLENQNNERELKYSKLYDKSIDTINEYNDLVQNLARKEVFQKAIGNESIVLNIHNLKEPMMLNETKERLKQQLLKANNQIRERRYKLEAEKVTLQEQIDKQSELIVEKKDEQIQLLNQLENAKKDCETQKKIITSRYEGQMMEMKSKQLRLDEENQQLTTKLEEQFEVLKAAKEEFWKKKEEDKKKMNDYADFLIEYKTEVRKCFQKDEANFAELDALLDEENKEIDLAMKSLNIDG